MPLLIYHLYSIQKAAAGLRDPIFQYVQYCSRFAALDFNSYQFTGQISGLFFV
jgi:hypothetical protein